MKALSPEEYNALNSRLRVCIELLKPEMTKEAVDHVDHYVEHGEIEMAYESLVLSCIREGCRCDKNIASELGAIGVALGMETESVFDANFWQIAQPFFQGISPSSPPPGSPSGG